MEVYKYISYNIPNNLDINHNDMYYVYKITNKINGKVYIGKTSNLESRWTAHINASKRPSDAKHYLVHRAIAKYGENNFSFIEIEKFNSEEESLDKERYWIAQYKSNVCKYGPAYGYNLTDGGDGASGYKHTEESKQIMSLLKQGVYDGENNPNWGKIMPEETRQSISQTRTGKVCGEKNHSSKLKLEDIPVIRQLISEKKSDRKIAAIFGVTRNVIRMIRLRQTWKEVP